MSRELIPAPSRVLAKPDQNPVAVYLATLAPGASRRSMMAALEKIAKLAGAGSAASFPWNELRHQHVAALRQRLADQFAPASTNQALAGLRGVLKACWRLGLLAGDDYQRAVDVPSVKGSRLPRGRSLEGGELRELFRACADDEGLAGRRDAAIFAVGYGGGLRRSEIADLDLADYDQETGELRVRSGKGNKERTAYATNGAKTAIDAWLEVRGAVDGPLFLPINKGGKIGTKRMTSQAVYNVMTKRSEEAGIDRFSPHDLRRSFVSDMLDAGADVSLVQQLAGHANVQTTLRYDRRPEHAKRKAAELLHVPFNGYRVRRRKAQ